MVVTPSRASAASRGLLCAIRLVYRGGAGRAHGCRDASARPRNLRVRGPLLPRLELVGAIAGIDEVGVAVDESRRDPMATRIERSRGAARQVTRRPDPRDAIAGDADGAVAKRAVGRGAGHRREMRVPDHEIEIAAAHRESRPAMPAIALR